MSDGLGLCQLMGSYEHSLDDKGRLNFPINLREQLGETFWVTRGTSGRFLAVYSNEGWQDVMQQIMDVDGPEGEKLRRWMCSGAVEVTPDKQGRILIPQPLRNYAGIQRKVAVIGAGKKAEIWDYDAYMADDMNYSPSGSGVLNGLRL